MPRSSRVTRVRLFNCTMRVPRTHCARSLSGVHTITRSTRASREAATAAAASASSASNSTIGQTTMPAADNTLSRTGNCAADQARRLHWSCSRTTTGCETTRSRDQSQLQCGWPRRGSSPTRTTGRLEQRRPPDRRHLVRKAVRSNAEIVRKFRRPGRLPLCNSNTTLKEKRQLRQPTLRDRNEFSPNRNQQFTEASNPRPLPCQGPVQRYLIDIQRHWQPPLAL